MTCITSTQTLVSCGRNFSNHLRRQERTALRAKLATPFVWSWKGLANPCEPCDQVFNLCVLFAGCTLESESAMVVRLAQNSTRNPGHRAVCQRNRKCSRFSGIEYYIGSDRDAVDADIDSVGPDQAAANSLLNLNIHHFGKGISRTSISKLSDARFVAHN